VSVEVRRRVLLGVGIPVLAFVFLGVLIFAFSRILLAVPESLAPWVALLFATNILVGCALAATIRGTRGFAFLVVLLVGTILGGGIAGAVVGERPVHSLIEGEEAAGPPPPGAPSPGQAPSPAPSPPGEPIPTEEGSPPEAPGGGAVSIVAQGIAFDVAELSLPAEGEVAIAFDNRDQGIPHNVAIYTDAGDPVFQGEIITGPARAEYRFPAPPPGSYQFRCDVHPQMQGTATVG
jgi:plastocyanin